MPLQHAWDRKQARDDELRHQEDARIIQALEIAGCPRQCSWRKCEAVLGSWELLRMHVEKMHCEDISLKQASLSRPYRCHWAACQNRIFSFPSLLLEHVVSSHLEYLKLRCPFRCKVASTKVQPLVQHLKLVHNTTPYELPSAQIRQPPPQQEPLPELPTRAPTYLVSSLVVRPSPSFDPANASAAIESKDRPHDEWDDFAYLDDPDASEMEPFEPLRWPVAEEHPIVRTVPRYFGEKYDDGPQEKKAEASNKSESREYPISRTVPRNFGKDADGPQEKKAEYSDKSESSEEGPKIGFAYWKRKFQKDTERQQRRNRNL